MGQQLSRMVSCMRVSQVGNTPSFLNPIPCLRFICLFFWVGFCLLMFSLQQSPLKLFLITLLVPNNQNLPLQLSRIEACFRDWPHELETFPFWI